MKSIFFIFNNICYDNIFSNGGISPYNKKNIITRLEGVSHKKREID